MDRLALLRCLALPFHTAPLLLVAIFSVMLRLAVYAGLLGLPAILIIGSWFFKYAFLLLDHAAQGRPGAPVLSIEAANPVGEMRPLAYGLGVGVFYMATAALEPLAGPALVTAIRLLGLLALPAVVATHAITGSFSEALYPATIARVVRRLGTGYLIVLCVTVACGWAGRAVVLDGAHLYILLRIALLMLLWLALFAVLGGVIHERRLELGFEPEHSPERLRRRDERERERERDHFIDQLFAEYRAGARGNAWATIEQRVRRSTDAAAEYAWIYERVAGWPDPRLADRVAQELLPRLLAANRTGDALRIAQGRLQASEHWRPETSAQLVRLAELARDGGDRPLARALLVDFDHRFPDDPAQGTVRRLSEQLAR